MGAAGVFGFVFGTVTKQTMTAVPTLAGGVGTRTKGRTSSLMKLRFGRGGFGGFGGDEGEERKKERGSNKKKQSRARRVAGDGATISWSKQQVQAAG